MLVDDFVDLGHNANGFGEGDDDLLVMVDVVFGEFAAPAVLEPSFANLITTNTETPHAFGHALEADTLLFVDPNSFTDPGDLFNFRTVIS